MRAAIFDLDGTLLDSMGVWERVDEAFCKRRNLPFEKDYPEKLRAMHFQEAAEFTIKYFGLNETPRRLMEEWYAMAAEEYAHSVRLKPGGEEYLRLLKASGVKLGIATTSSERLYLPALVNNGVADLFDAFCTTEEAGRGKRYPDVYLLAAQKLGVPPADCAVFEDILIGARAASEAGMQVYGVYDSSSASDEAAIRQLSVRYIRNFHELIKKVPAPDMRQ